MPLIACGAELYAGCCAKWNAKPNEAIQSQLDRPDALRLTVLDATNNFLGAPGTHAVLDVVLQHRCLEALLLPRNGVDVECVRHLCDVLQTGTHPSLRHVDLSYNDLSVPSVRLLWQAACAVPTLTSVSIAGCGIPSEWEERLRRTTEANARLQREGYFAHGPPRSPAGCWRTVFLLLLGAPQHVARYCDVVLPAVASYAAHLRVRVAPLVIRPEDTRVQVERKLHRCQEPHGNGGRTWCVVLTDAAAPLCGREIFALKHVLTEGPLPPPVPLNDKLGHQRPPMYKAAQTLFTYYANPSNITEEVGDGVELIPPPRWLRMAGMGTGTADNPAEEADLQAFSEFVRQPACVLSDASYSLRCQSDLWVALQALYREPEPGALHENDGTVPTVPLITVAESAAGKTAAHGVDDSSADDVLPYEALFPRTVDVVRSYLFDSDLTDGTNSGTATATASRDRVNVPLLLYGGEGTGKAGLLAHLANQWARRHELPTATSSRRVVLIDVGVGNTSLVVVLMRLLAVLTGKQPLVALGCPAPSLPELCSVVRVALERYAGPPLALLLPCLDAIDSCGFPLSSVVEWLPACLPLAVKCVVTLTTESALLSVLRQRAPQPLETLVSPPGERGRLIVLRHFLRRATIELPGLTDTSDEAEAAVGHPSYRPSPQKADAGLPQHTAAEAAYLAKDGATCVLFARLTAACARSGGRRNKKSTAADTAVFVEDELPSTLSEAVLAVARAAEAMSHVETVCCLLGCLCAAPLPVPDIQFICEELEGCPNQTTVPALLELVDAGLVTWRADSTVYVQESAARSILAEQYCGRAAADRCLAAVESHLYRLVLTASPEAADAFRYLIPLMLNGGNVRLASALLLNNTPVLDGLLSADVAALDVHTGGETAPNQLYVLDGLLRLVAARDLLVQLTWATLEGDGSASPLAAAAVDLQALQRAIVDIQRVRSGQKQRNGAGALGSTAASDLPPMTDALFQSAVWETSNSPFSQDAQHRLARPPYPVLTPLNDGCEDQSLVRLDCGGCPCSYLHCSPTGAASSSGEAYVVATVTSTRACSRAACDGAVYVFRQECADNLHSPAPGQVLPTARTPVAKFLNPFEETGEVLVAALSAADSRVVIVSESSVVIWDFLSHTATRLSDLVVDTRTVCMNAFGTQVIARQAYTSHVVAVSTGSADGSATNFQSMYCIVDVMRKAVVRRLPQHSRTSLHMASFCGNQPMVVEGSVVYRFRNENELCGEATALFTPGQPPIQMNHDELVECVASNDDGRLLATSTGATLWIWMATTGELLHRVETAFSSVLSLRFNHSGSQLLCRHAEGLFLWRTATGTCVAPVANPLSRAAQSPLKPEEAVVAHPFHPHMDDVGFSGDGARLLGRVGRFAVLWDSLILAPVAAVSPPTGAAAALCERDGLLYLSSTTHGDVQVFASPLPSFEQAVARLPTTSNLLTNGKVSTVAIREVSADPSGTTVACIDKDNRLRVFSLTTGAEVTLPNHHSEDACDTNRVWTVALVAADAMLYIPADLDPTVGVPTVYSVSLSLMKVAASCSLPKELVYVPDANGVPPCLRLRGGTDGAYAGVEYSYRGHSRLLVLALDRHREGGDHVYTCRLHCQLVGHTGPLLDSVFFGSFAFTVGATDGMVRLWSLGEPHKGSERTSYQHACGIRAVTCEPSAPGVLLVLDADGALHRVSVSSIASATRASFVVETLPLPQLQRWAQTFGPAASLVVAAAGEPLLLCTAGVTGAASLFRVSQDAAVVELRPGSPLHSLAACKVQGRPCVLMGLADGRLVVASVRQRSQRRQQQQQQQQRGEMLELQW